ncbi:unnamed protein product, partial [Vitis vinifera]
MGSSQAAVSFLTNLARAAFGLGAAASVLNASLYTPYIFDIRTRPHTFSSVSGTKDLQMVNLTLRVLSRPEVLKAVVAQFNADQLLTDRPHVSALVRDSLIRRAKDFNIVLDDVAQQEAERSKFVVAKAEQERRAAIIRAEGESESAKLISDATAAAGMGALNWVLIYSMIQPGIEVNFV